MKIYEIIDSEEKLSIGCLLFFEKEKSCIIELQDYLDEWNAPLLYAQTVKEGRFTIGRELSHTWVSERVIPSGRQNIDSILAHAKLARYDEMALLEKANGRCSQDSMYVKRIDSIPKFVEERMGRNLIECIPCDNQSLLCFFADETVKKVDLKSLSDVSDINKILAHEAVFKSAHIAAGGYCVTFNDSIDISAEILYKKGVEIPLSLQDFLSFVNLNMLDSSESCSVLECSRQNLSRYISKEILTPVKKNVKGNLYTKGNLHRHELIEALKNKAQ